MGAMIKKVMESWDIMFHGIEVIVKVSLFDQKVVYSSKIDILFTLDPFLSKFHLVCVYNPRRR